MKHWAAAMESVLRLGLPWRVLRSQLVGCNTQDGTFNYHDWLGELDITEPNSEVTSGSIEITFSLCHT